MMDVTVVHDNDAAGSGVRIGEWDLKAIENEVNSDEKDKTYHIVMKKLEEPLR